MGNLIQLGCHHVKDSISEPVKISDSIAVSLQDLDPIIAALCKSVGITQAEGPEYVRLPSVDDLKAFLKLFKLRNSCAEVPIL